jgi:hypothetical protein
MLLWLVSNPVENETHALESIDFLLRRGGHPTSYADDEGNTAFHYAAQNNQAGIMRRFIQVNGTDLNVSNNLGETALMQAVMHGHQGIVSLLVTNDVDVNATDEEGNTAFDYVVDNPNIKNRAAIARMLIVAGAHWNSTDHQSHSLIREVFSNEMSLYSATIGKIDLMDISQGTDNDSLSRILHVAAVQGHTALVSILLKRIMPSHQTIRQLLCLVLWDMSRSRLKQS